MHTILEEDLNIKAKQHNVFILQQYATSLWLFVLKQLVVCLGKNQYFLVQRKFDRDTWQVQKGEGLNLVSSITFTLRVRL